MDRKKWNKRSGVATLESAIILTTSLVLVLGILDLGMATYRYNLLADAARRLAREAIVRGAEASPEVQPWGPTEIVGTAADNTPPANLIRPLLVGFDLSKVTVNVVWLEGDNTSESRVRVQLEYSHKPLTLLNLGAVNLRATSTMRIVH